MYWKSSLLALALPVLAVESVAAEAYWPAFRGPDRQGHAESAKLPLEWSTTKNVQWKTAVAGIGWSSPVVAEGKVFLTSAILAKGDNEDDPKAERNLHVIALDLESGQELWNVTLFDQGGPDAPRTHKKNSHASPTPIYEDGRLYVHFGHQGTAALAVKDGAVLWKTRKIEYVPVHGGGGSPTVWEDFLIFSCDGSKERFVVALDKNSGREKWRTERHGDVKRRFSFTTPLVIEVNGRSELISPGSGGVFAYDPASGRELWHAGYGEGYSVIPRPVFGDGRLYLGTGYDKATAMAVRPGGDGDVTDTHVDWIVSKRAPHTPSLLFDQGLVYMVSDGGIASCLDAATGDVIWQERATGSISASPILADGRIYLQDEQGRGVVLAAGREFRILAENDLEERSLASYAVAGDSLLIRTAGHLYRIGTGG